MNQHLYTITFACHNAVKYTQACIESLIQCNIPLDRVVAVDNASTDDTVALLHSYPLGAVVLNRENLGCGVAWNQGVLAMQSEWSIIMNNDILASSGCFDALLKSGVEHQLKIVSPALIEGDLDYDFHAFAALASHKMNAVFRPDFPHAVCMAVHRSVWHDIGFFAPVPKLWGYEDTLFFHQARAHHIPMGSIGSSWLHHFGSITQNEIRRERGLSQHQGLGSRSHYRLLHQHWISRKLAKIRRKAKLAALRHLELATYGMTLHGTRTNHEFQWL